MPGSSQRRVRTRKVPDNVDKSDGDDVGEIVTPSRKRRRVNNDQPRVASIEDTVTASRTTGPASRRKGRSNDIKVFEDESSFNEDDPDALVRFLRCAKYGIAARQDYANEVHELNSPEGKQAYAKIAGNGWTFYVDELKVRIGRPPDERQSVGRGEGQNGDTADDNALVHIDLGPSKLVSRQHAEIRYEEQNNGQWVIQVNGRNGAKLDELPLNRGDTGILHSGVVIEIAGTQMMFVTPNDTPEVHPTIIAQAKARGRDAESDEDDVDLMGPPTLPHRTPTRGAGSRLSHQGPSSTNQKHTSSAHGQGRRGNLDYAAAPSALVQHDGSGEAREPSSQAKHGTSPTFPRGLMLETAEDIDYAADSARDLKPPHSYAQLIGMAILSNPEEKLTLAKIYDWIKERYAFYRFSNGGWQNSIRHNLSLNKCFEKVARRTDEPGKGMKWQIVPEQRDDFLKKGLSNVRRSTGRSSNPGSPSREDGKGNEGGRGSALNFAKEFQDAPEAARSGYGMKVSPGSTPPMSHYPLVKQAFTPDRSGGGLFGQYRGADASSPMKAFGAGGSPFPFSVKGGDKWSGLTEAAAAGSPGGPRISFGSDPNEQLVTPLITKHAPKLAPPSTARLPSMYMPMSSPAPFWKYADFGSTPAKLESSPVKSIKTLAKDGEEGKIEGKEREDKEEGKAETGPRSSSPPVAEGEVGQGSPTRAMSSRGGDRVTMGPMAGSLQAPRSRSGTLLPPPPAPAAPATRGEAEARGPRKTSQAPSPPRAAGQTEEEDEEDEEGGMIDLARGFQPIGSFHRNMNAGLVGRD